MTVKELIEELQRLDQDLPVVVEVNREPEAMEHDDVDVVTLVEQAYNPYGDNGPVTYSKAVLLV